MSIKEMNRVWDKSKAEKTALLAMLALADMANDDGISWPGQDTIAKKARTTRRSIISIVQERTAAGELAYIARSGKQHVYCLLTGLTQEEQNARLKLFREQYQGNLFTCENIAHVLKTSQVPVYKTSHLPVQKHAQKRTRSIIEPSVDPSMIGEAKETVSPPQPITQPAPQLYKHPAIQAYRDETHRYPAKAWYQTIIDAVGDNIDKWRGIAREWVGRGWNPSNVKGMLDVYANGWQKPDNGKWVSGVPATIPQGMGKESRSDIKTLTPEEAEAAKAEIRRTMLREREHAANQNAA